MPLMCLSALQDRPVGPHPLANLEVLFTRERYAAMLNYLVFALPTTFSCLIHQLTADQVKSALPSNIYTVPHLSMRTSGCNMPPKRPGQEHSAPSSQSLEFLFQDLLLLKLLKRLTCKAFVLAA